MDRSKETYEMIRKNLLFEEKLYYPTGSRKASIGCLVKSKYADQSDQIELFLFESKSSRGPFMCFDVIEYDRAEKSAEIKQVVGWWPSRTIRTVFTFDLLPKHQVQRESAACDTDEQRTNWLKALNHWIEKAKSVTSYSSAMYYRRSYSENLVDKQLVVIYDGSFDELAKLLFSIHQPGVYAVNRKNTPEKNCLWALRVFEENQNKLSSWNIYQKGQAEEYSLARDHPTFSSFVDLCVYYTHNDLPVQWGPACRLTSSYKDYPFQSDVTGCSRERI